ncbi:hypothetical protein RIF29_22398 [Crotalaria pallida]|uniref:Uncharacterized protein n=1 Tax=Crotalaria pallida TaxID=3830 RepID=A0AAN9I9C0_CROPI
MSSSSASFLSDSVECANVFKLVSLNGRKRKGYSVVSCSFKAPRVLAGLLATKAYPVPCCLIAQREEGTFIILDVKRVE